MIWPDTHSAPGLRDLVGVGFGLGDLLRDLDGDGLGECDGLGLLVAVGLVEVLLWLGLDEIVGLGVPDGVALLDALLLAVFDGLVVFEALLLAVFDGLELFEALLVALFAGLVLFDGLALVCRIRGAELGGAAIKCADSAATELCPHGDAIGKAEDARTGAAVKPEARNVPAAKQMAMRPARMTPSGTGALRSSGQLQPNRDAGAATCPQA